uniref:non-specific serine/threonine protein kinase n=1 Tax=Kalanchoe fedtschenkoi TaxID=63787 RepID=A0A7N0VH09_KALFE
MPTCRSPPLCSTVLCFLFISRCYSAVQSDDLETLLSLKSSIRSASDPGLFDSWNPANSVCHFAGVSCNSDGYVTQIELSKQGLTGTLALDLICKLPSLEKLTLGANLLSGEVRPELNKCVQLVYLDLGQNSFSGSFPDISALSRLEHLYLNHSGFSGPFPWSALSSMPNLITLSLGDNPFDPTDAFPREILKLKKLSWVFLSNCSIQGTIPPEIGDLSELISLELSNNHLSGIIPPEMAKLRNLWQLELYRNNLTGKLPYGFRNLTNLAMFDASANHLSGDLSELRFLTNLVSLQMYQNQLTGGIPAEFGMFKQLVNISLYTNKLTGSLPQKLGSWAEFGFIDVSENYLTGPIPPDMCNKGTMFALLMLQNNITGSIPESYGNCTSLERFRVSDNLLSGTVPAAIWGLPLINIIDISSNQLEGRLSSTIAKAKALTTIRASNNKLSGELPQGLASATSLQAIDLQNNQISGGLPSKIGNLKQLSTLYLQNNKITGSIPKSLGFCSSLNDINIAENLLTGRIPSSLGSLPTLNFLNLSGNRLSGSIPESLSSLRLSLLDLSNNRLTGRVPQSLSIEAYNGSFAANTGLCSQNIKYFQPCSSSRFRQLKTLIILFISAMLILLFALSAFIFQKRFSWRRQSQERSLKRDSWNLKSFHVLTFTEDDVLDSVKQENLIGKGRSGNVYRLALPSGKDLAVKHIWTNNNNGDSESVSGSRPMLGKRPGKLTEFEAEVEMLSSIRHVNVVKLYCSITSEDSSLLVCEYMPGGSLWDQIHSGGKCELDWVSRHEIALGSAKGLEYLHHGLDRPVIHRDVKSSNILLDELLKPRIADFGLAKVARAKGGAVGSDSTHVIAGTLGYIAPEYGYTYKVNEKSDVYSFGVVLMELVTGKTPMEPEYGENRDIVHWVCSKVKNRESVLSLVDSRIADEMKDEAIKVLRIAILCTARLPTLRPTMRRVVQMLEESEPCKLVRVPASKDLAAKQDEEDVDEDRCFL